MTLSRLPRIIGMTGPTYAGKDTVALYLVEHHGFTQCSIADNIKLVAMQQYGLSIAQVTTALKDRIDPRWNRTPRELLQHTGMSGRQAKDSVWIDLLQRTFINPIMNHGGYVVLSDIREAIEVDMIRRHGGEIWRIQRNNAEAIAKQHGIPDSSAGHKLERNHHDFKADICIQNNGTLTELQAHLKDILSSLYR